MGTRTPMCQLRAKLEQNHGGQRSAPGAKLLALSSWRLIVLNAFEKCSVVRWVNCCSVLLSSAS